MKNKLIISLFLTGLLLAMSFLTGCATPQNPYTYQGAGLGAAVGAAIGAGANGKNPWKGAGIGALIGGAAGAIGGEIYGRSNPYYPPQQSGYGYNRPYQGYYSQQAPPPQASYGTYQDRAAQEPYYQYGY
ncbi:MAG: glycine zipper domain-containing protein [Syntrophobacterales bacterium]|jgi:hypothetical protein